MKILTKTVSILSLIFQIVAIFCTLAAVHYLHLEMEPLSLKWDDVASHLYSLVRSLLRLRFCIIPVLILVYEVEKNPTAEMEALNHLPAIECIKEYIKRFLEKPKKVEVFVFSLVLISWILSMICHRLAADPDGLTMMRYHWICFSASRILASVLGIILPPKLFRTASQPKEI